MRTTTLIAVIVLLMSCLPAVAQDYNQLTDTGDYTSAADRLSRYWLLNS